MFNSVFNSVFGVRCSVFGLNREYTLMDANCCRLLAEYVIRVYSRAFAVHKNMGMLKNEKN